MGSALGLQRVPEPSEEVGAGLCLGCTEGQRVGPATLCTAREGPLLAQRVDSVPADFGGPWHGGPPFESICCGTGSGGSATCRLSGFGCWSSRVSLSPATPFTLLASERRLAVPGHLTGARVTCVAPKACRERGRVIDIAG